MRTKLLAIVLSLFIVGCATAPSKTTDTSKIACTRYIEMEVSQLECFNALYVLVQQGMLEMVYAEIDGEPVTVLLNLGEELWSDNSEEGQEGAKRVLGLALLAFKGFSDAKVVKIFFSGTAIMEFFRDGDNICVRNLQVKEDPKEKDSPMPNWKFKVER